MSEVVEKGGTIKKKTKKVRRPKVQIGKGHIVLRRNSGGTNGLRSIRNKLMTDFFKRVPKKKPISNHVFVEKKIVSKVPAIEGFVAEEDLLSFRTLRSMEYLICDKLRVLEKVKRLKLSPGKFSKGNKLIERKIQDWFKKESGFRALSLQEQKTRRRLPGGGSQRKFTFDEEVTILEMVYGNNIGKQVVTDQDIRNCANLILKSKSVDDGKEVSNGWLEGFKKRFHLVSRKAGKDTVAKDLVSFLSSQMYEMRRDVINRKSKLKYKLIGQDHLAYDEAALNDEKEAERTIVTKGTKNVRLKSQGNTKSRITINPVYEGGNGKLVILQLIFKCPSLKSKQQFIFSNSKKEGTMRNVNWKTIENHLKKIQREDLIVLICASQSGFMNFRTNIYLYEYGVDVYNAKKKKEPDGTQRPSLIASDVWYTHHPKGYLSSETVELRELAQELEIVMKDCIDIEVRANTTGFCQIGDVVCNKVGKDYYKGEYTKFCRDEQKKPDRTQKILFVIDGFNSVDQESVKTAFVDYGLTTRIDLSEESRLKFDVQLKSYYDKEFGGGRNRGRNFRKEKSNSVIRKTAWKKAVQSSSTKSKKDKAKKVALENKVDSIAVLTSPRFVNIVKYLVEQKKPFFNFVDLKALLVSVGLLFDLSDNHKTKIVQEWVSVLCKKGILVQSGDIFILNMFNVLPSMYLTTGINIDAAKKEYAGIFDDVTDLTFPKVESVFSSANEKVEKDLSLSDLEVDENPVAEEVYPEFEKDFLFIYVLDNQKLCRKLKKDVVQLQKNTEVIWRKTFKDFRVYSSLRSVKVEGEVLVILNSTKKEKTKTTKEKLMKLKTTKNFRFVLVNHSIMDSVLLERELYIPTIPTVEGEFGFENHNNPFVPESTAGKHRRSEDSVVETLVEDCNHSPKTKKSKKENPKKEERKVLFQEERIIIDSSLKKVGNGDLRTENIGLYKVDGVKQCPVCSKTADEVYRCIYSLSRSTFDLKCTRFFCQRVVEDVDHSCGFFNPVQRGTNKTYEPCCSHCQFIQ